MNTRTLQHTQTSVILAVNVVSKGDSGLQFTVYTICQLAPILFTLWQLSTLLTTAAAGVLALVGDIAGVVNVGGKVVMIAFNALVFGLIGGVV